MKDGSGIKAGDKLTYDGIPVTVERIDHKSGRIWFHEDDNLSGYSNIPLHECRPGRNQTNLEKLEYRSPLKVLINALIPKK